MDYLEFIARVTSHIPDKGQVMVRYCGLYAKCGGTMKVIAFITEYAVADRIINHLKLRFVADTPPPPHVFEQVALMAAEESVEYS
jgi:hypothetical protein